MPYRHVAETTKTLADVAAPTLMVGAMLQYLPYWAAAFTIIWTGMRIYDWIELKIDRVKARKRVKNLKKGVKE